MPHWWLPVADLRRRRRDRGQHCAGLQPASQAITANTLKPASCNGITLTNVVIGNNGTAPNDLLGSAAANNMNGAGGNDCILGGGGNDTIAGGGGTDVCIGGPGTDTFNNNCETQIQ